MLEDIIKYTSLIAISVVAKYVALLIFLFLNKTIVQPPRTPYLEWFSSGESLC